MNSVEPKLAVGCYLILLGTITVCRLLYDSRGSVVNWLFGVSCGSMVSWLFCVSFVGMVSWLLAVFSLLAVAVRLAGYGNVRCGSVVMRMLGVAVRLAGYGNVRCGSVVSWL